MKNVIPTVVVGASILFVSAYAQTNQEHSQHHPPAPAKKTATMKCPCMQNGMAMMDPGMMKSMAARDQKIDSLAKTMNSSTGDKKLNAAVALINELLAERKAMHEMMHQHMGHGAPSAGGEHKGGEHKHGNGR